MALNWTVLTDQHLVVVKGHGRVTREDIDEYLAATIRSGAKAYAKLIEIGATSTLDLSADDLDHVVQSQVDYARDGGVGPVAIVVHSPLNLDMAMLLKQRIGNRPYSIFVSTAEAIVWLRAFLASPALYAAQVPSRQAHATLSLANQATSFDRQGAGA
jgi:hypothetical protein